MEKLLHYCWTHRIGLEQALHAHTGLPLQVIDTGLPNTDAGPDFFNAKIKIGDTLWVGNVELHCRASEWFAHGHHMDPHYEGVILHVAEQLDAQALTRQGREVPQLCFGIPQEIRQNYESLLQEAEFPPCHKIVPTLKSITLRSWLTALQTERLARKTEDICARVARCGGRWDAACFVTLARNFGFGTNSDAMELWASGIDPGMVGHHRDNIFQVEAFFLGQAGLLDADTKDSRKDEETIQDEYHSRLEKEYDFLRRKFGLTPMKRDIWRFLRLRPQNFPHLRIAQLAMLYHRGATDLNVLLHCGTTDELRKMLQTDVSEYWQSHFTFGRQHAPLHKRLSAASVDLLLINTVAPLLFAYGKTHGKEQFCERAADILEQTEAENNKIVRKWKQCGMTVRSAGDTQALIQLQQQYCDRKECIRCRIGYEYLKGKTIKI